jgi:hypothetical protein
LVIPEAFFDVGDDLGDSNFPLLCPSEVSDNCWGRLQPFQSLLGNGILDSPRVVYGLVQHRITAMLLAFLSIILPVFLSGFKGIPPLQRLFPLFCRAIAIAA